MDWFLYDYGLRHETVKKLSDKFFSLIAQFCIIFVKFNIQTIDEDHMGLFQQYASIYFYYLFLLYILNLLVQFKFTVTHEKPIMQEDLFYRTLPNERGSCRRYSVKKKKGAL